MKIKTFYAKNMTEALQEIRTQLGPEALLLSTKEIPCRSGKGGRASGFEVVAAIDTNESDRLGRGGISEVGDYQSISMTNSLESAPVGGFCTATYTRATLLNDLPPAARAAGNGKRPALKRRRAPGPKESPASSPPPIVGTVASGLYQDLLASGVHEWLARKLIADAWDSLSAGQRRIRSTILRALAKASQQLITVPHSSNGLPSKRVVAFVGPTGVGKTTSIAKLAARLALQERKKVVLMTLDGYRIGAVEQLRTYAGLMGVPFRYISQIADLPCAIDENAQRDYVLIDTAGRGPRDLQSMEDLASFLRQSDHVERHLVLSATTKSADMQEIADRFEICRPDHLLFTKVDETATLGSILNELVRSRKSVAYYTNGQKVPEDLHAASKELIIDMVLKVNPSRSIG